MRVFMNDKEIKIFYEVLDALNIKKIKHSRKYIILIQSFYLIKKENKNNV